MTQQHLDFLVNALTRNMLSADEFQKIFVKLSPPERMQLLERLDAPATQKATR